MIANVPPANTQIHHTRIWVFVGLVCVLASFFINGLIVYGNIRLLQKNHAALIRSQDTLLVIQHVLSLLKDAETGQRGFILTGDERYLAPFNDAIARLEPKLVDLDRLITDSNAHQEFMSSLRSSITAKLAELDETIQLRRRSGMEAALAVVTTDRGKLMMDRIRASLESMEKLERQASDSLIATMDTTYNLALFGGVSPAIVGTILTVLIAYQLNKSMAYRTRQEAFLSGKVALNHVMAGEFDMNQLGDNLLRFFATFLHADAGAFFARTEGVVKRFATLGVPTGAQIPDTVTPNEGLLGQAMESGRRVRLTDFPSGFLVMGSALTQGTPQHLIISPIIMDSRAIGLIELGFLREMPEFTDEFLEKVNDSVATAIRSANYRAHLRELLDRTQAQTEELRAQREELRASNEELAEQGEILRESQVRLQNQQAELEQVNTQLEEQTQLLEAERDEVSRAKTAIEEQARQLHSSNQYKSTFLANMSHELRTPLNSSLILAKLLADNPQGNLTAEQVRYAETIESAGQDLLVLINDILDLSKIEAGHLEIRPEIVWLSEVLDAMDRMFRPMATQKQLAFHIDRATDCPDELKTDPLRLEQILKNLLSNAFKFTKSGEVRLSVRRNGSSNINFIVQDTGIGISEEDQRLIFDAFRQADNTIRRNYGGTGLGLSICRELAELLHGSISLVSEVDQGSSFTLTTPIELGGSTSTDASSSTPGEATLIMAEPDTGRKENVLMSVVPYPVPRRDARQSGQHGRVLLIVEDDLAFAKILEELATAQHFEPHVARTAEDAVEIALQTPPDAIVLDLKLPDHSGLWVLDRLKHEAKTRHIPVHVISGSDDRETAMSLGAVGYLLKPVQNDQLVDALKQLASRTTNKPGRILVVEDDHVQRESICQVLSSFQIESVAVGTSAEALEQLKDTTFDCMVLDLSLPGASGFSMLRTLSEEMTYSFPPVIVYTAGDLSRDEEQELRRYSKSIIIKGARSPERLLDEVILFLHRVESELPCHQRRMLERARHRDAALEGKRVLVVEDDVRNVFALTSLLEPRGVQVEIARNGREAIDQLNKIRDTQAPPIDMILMDVMMPEMDGLTAVKKIRESPEWVNTPIIMLTAKAMKDDHESCLKAGANDYLAKPLDAEKLASLIRIWMRR